MLIIGLLAVRYQRVTIISSAFKGISNSYGLKAVCNNETLTSNRMVASTCSSFSLGSWSFPKFDYNGWGTGWHGGAIKLESIDNATIYKCEFESISAGNSGGAIYFNTVSNITLLSNNYSHCKAKDGGCLYFSISPKIYVNGNIFNDSSSKSTAAGGGYGGTIRLEKTENAIMIIKNCSISISKSITVNGGAIYCDGASVIDMEGNTFSDCDANSGGALYFSGITTKISISDNFERVQCIKEGGTIYIDASKKVDIKNSRFLDSRVPNEPEEGSTARNGGTLYISSNSDVTIDNCIFNYSICSYGNGGACYLTKLTGLTLTNSKFIDCRAQLYGGAIHLESSSSVNMTENCFSKCVMINETNKEERIGGAINIYSASPVTIKSNKFEDCFALHWGGAISFSSFNILELNRNIFRNCSVLTQKGGAVRIILVDYINFIKNSFILCSSNEYGGAVFLSDITNKLYKTYFTGDEYIECTSKYYGGAISLYTVNTVIMDGIKSSKCESPQGGFLYTHDIQNGINISNSNFESCSSANGGGAVYTNRKATGTTVFYIKTDNSTFTKCTGGTGNGGAFFIERNVNHTIFLNSHFLSCSTNEHGGAIYHKYDYSLSKDPTTLIYDSNVFEGCESGNYGSIMIDSNHIDTGVFENNVFINCKAKVLGNGGAFMAVVAKYCSFSFKNCSFSGCTATLKFGALGIKLNNGKSDGSSTITLSGCSFENCSSPEAACFGTELKTPDTVTVNIQGNKKIFSTFQSITKTNDKFAVFTDASILNIEQTSFDHVEIGAFNCSSDNIVISDCTFNNSKSESGMIYFPSLKTFTMSKIIFTQCNYCFIAKCTGLSSISSLTISGCENNAPSTLDSRTIQMTDLNIINNKEQLSITTFSFEISGGSMTNNEKEIEITGTSEASSLFYAHDLTVVDSLMFSVSSLVSTSIKNCIIKYDVPGSTNSKSVIATSSLSSNTISNCTFSTNNVTPIDFKSVGSKGSLDNCTFNGRESVIKVANTLTIKNCEFSSPGKSLEITGRTGKIILEFDTNCFRNNIFEDAISVGESQVTDSNNVKISKFDSSNNKCEELPATSELFFHEHMTSIVQEEATKPNSPSFTSEFNNIQEHYSSENYIQSTTEHIEPKVTYTSNIIENDNDLSSQHNPVDFEKSSFLIEKTQEEIIDHYSSQLRNDTEEKIFIDSSIHNTKKVETTIETLHPATTNLMDHGEQKESTKIETEELRTTINAIQEEQESVQITREHKTSDATEIITKIIPTSHENEVKQTETIITRKETTHIEYNDDSQAIYEQKITETLDEPKYSSKNEPKIILTTHEPKQDIPTASIKVPTKEMPTISSITKLITEKEIAASNPIEKVVEKDETIQPRVVHTTEKEPIKNKSITEEKQIPPSNHISNNKFNSIDYDNPEANIANNDKSASTGLIAGAAVGAIVVVIIIIIVIYLIACRKRNKNVSSNDMNETEFESMESSTAMIQMEFKTAYTTQEMPTSTWTCTEIVNDNNDDFLSIEDSD